MRRPNEPARDDGHLLVGRRSVEELLQEGGEAPERIWVLDEAGARAWWARGPADLARKAGATVAFVPRAALDRLAPDGVAHQGVAARLAPVALAEAHDLMRSPDALLVLVDGIEDPRNLGAVLRSAAAAGAQGVLLPERRVAGLGPACAKASAGAIRRIPLARVKNVARAIEDLAEAGVWSLGLDVEAPPLWTLDLVRPTCLVVGGEGRGLSRLARERCDALGGIPMARGVESLKAAVAAGVALFEAVRQRQAAHGP